MGRDNYTDENYTQPHVPPATPPVVDEDVNADDAATLAMANGDSDFSGTNAYRFPRGAEDRELQHGDTIEPGKGGDTVDPQSPDELDPDGGDTTNPGRTPDETPPDSIPNETPLPPD